MDYDSKSKSNSRHKKHKHKSHKRAKYDDQDRSSSEREYQSRSKHRDVDKFRNRADSSKNSRDKEKSKDLKEQLTNSQATYRDRAKERREGNSIDFVLDPDDLQLYNPVPQEGTEDLNEDEQRLRMIEESKYLGGDVEHTHLVKGLDFALLQKVKNDQKTKEKPEFSLNDLDSDSDGEGIAGYESTKFIHCRTALARRILNLHDEKWPEKSELFLPGRMVYIMDLDDDQPVTAIIKSKVDG